MPKTIERKSDCESNRNHNSHSMMQNKTKENTLRLIKKFCSIQEKKQKLQPKIKKIKSCKKKQQNHKIHQYKNYTKKPLKYSHKNKILRTKKITNNSYDIYKKNSKHIWIKILKQRHPTNAKNQYTNQKKPFYKTKKYSKNDTITSKSEHKIKDSINL